MTTCIQPTVPSDAELVGRCLAGDRDAYRVIVERYQSLVCALTYAGCGDIHQSEDLAQETFLEGWKHLASLKDGLRLRPWLCGIAPNCTANLLRKQGRAPDMTGVSEDGGLVAGAPTPPEHAISREEQALLWRSLEQLPLEYREPMVLYYRQQESIARVAAALEISEEATRQRLSRGRAMVARRLEHVIRDGLRNSNPTKAFTIAVVAALPAVAASVKAASLGAGAVKGAAALKSGALLASALIGPLIGAAGGYLGYRMGLEQTVVPEERRLIRRVFWSIVLVAGVTTVVILIVAMRPHGLRLPPSVQVGVVMAISVLYAASLLGFSFWYQCHIRQMRARLVAARAEWAAQARAVAARWGWSCRSGWTLFGLPLIDVELGASPDARPTIARGWIAIGAKAYGGLFAFGAIAVAPISFGGLGVGLLTWGGFALGAVVFGGFGLGVWAVGGFAAGWKALGGVALAWSAASAGAALAHNYALGGLAVAGHANDSVARAFFEGDEFYRVCNACLPYANWLWIVALIPIAVMIGVAARKRRVAP